MTEENQNAPEAGQEQNNAAQPKFAVQRIYVKDLSFESPLGFEQIPEWKPKVNQDLNTQVNKVNDNLYEVILKLTVTVTPGEEDKTLFLAEVHQAGTFFVDGVEGVQLQHVLTAACPNILFPYAREAIDNMAIRGGFPAVVLPPINFDAVFAKAMADAQARAQSEGAETEAH